MKIRVNTDDLKSKSYNIMNISADLQRLTESVRNTAYTAPSYNGQFGPKVRSIGNAAYSSGSQKVTFLKLASSDLSSRAMKFSAADSKSIVGTAYKNTDYSVIDKQDFWSLINNRVRKIIDNTKEVINKISDIIINTGGTVITGLGGTIEVTGKIFDIHSLEQFGDWLQEYGQDMRASGNWAEPDIPITSLQEREEKYIGQIPEDLRSGWKEFDCPVPGTDAYLAFLLAYYTSEKYNNGESSVIILENGEKDYIVLIKGTNGNLMDISNYFQDENGWGNNISAFLGLQTGYEETVLRLIKNNISEGATLHLVGHSQGGIIANNSVADLMEMGYYVDSVTTFGGPPPPTYNQPDSVKCSYYAAKKDDVPQLSSYYAMLVSGKMSISDLLSLGVNTEQTQLLDLLMKRIDMLANGSLTYIEGKSDGTNVQAHDIKESYAKDEILQYVLSGFQQNTAEMKDISNSLTNPYTFGEVKVDASLKKTSTRQNNM